jgi:DNA-binding transcriptional LysR family regulator
LFAQFLVRGVPEIAWTAVDSLSAQKRLIEAGFGLALLQLSAAAEERALGSLAVIDVADLDVSIPIFAVVRRGGYLNAAAQGLLTLLRDAAGPPSRN